MSEIKNMPVVTVEQVYRFREAAIARIDELERVKENLIHQAEMQAQEARTQRGIVMDIGELVGCARDWEMVGAVKNCIAELEAERDDVAAIINPHAAEKPFDGDLRLWAKALEVERMAFAKRNAELEAQVAQQRAGVPEFITVSMAVHSKYAQGWNDCRAAMLAAPAPKTQELPNYHGCVAVSKDPVGYVHTEQAPQPAEVGADEGRPTDANVAEALIVIGNLVHGIGNKAIILEAVNRLRARAQLTEGAVTDDMRQAVRWAPSSAYWSQRLAEFFGTDARDGISALEKQLREAQAATQPAEVGADGAFEAARKAYVKMTNTHLLIDGESAYFLRTNDMAAFDALFEQARAQLTEGADGAADAARLRDALRPFAAIEIDCAAEIVPNGYGDPGGWRADVRRARAALTASGGRDEPDMFWNDGDPEEQFGSIAELVHAAWENGHDIGSEITIQQGVRLPNVIVRLLWTGDEDSGEPDYEIIAASQPAQDGE